MVYIQSDAVNYALIKIIFFYYRCHTARRLSVLLSVFVCVSSCVHLLKISLHACNHYIQGKGRER